MELSRKAEGVIPRSVLRNLFPKLALWFHTRDFNLEQVVCQFQKKQHNFIYGID